METLFFINLKKFRHVNSNCCLMLNKLHLLRIFINVGHKHIIRGTFFKNNLCRLFYVTLLKKIPKQKKVKMSVLATVKTIYINLGFLALWLKLIG